MKEPLARGVVVARSHQRASAIGALAKESLAILKAIDAEARLAESVPADADFALILVEESSARTLPLPDLKDRAASVVGVGEDAAATRAVIAHTRKELRAHAASLGARELVLHPEQFGVLGLESDGLREKLEVLLRALVVDAERLRLRREGWEEPDE